MIQINGKEEHYIQMLVTTLLLLFVHLSIYIYYLHMYSLQPIIFGHCATAAL